MSFADCIQASANCKPTIDIISIQHRTQNTKIITLKDSSNTAIDLTPYSIPDPDLELFTGVRLVVRDTFHNQQAIYVKNLTIDADPTTGLVSIPYEMDTFKDPGMFIAVIDLVIANEVKSFLSYYFEVIPGLDWTSHGPISIPEVRLALRDSCPEANTLIDDYEFTDSEIAYAIRRPVDYWNGCLPPICPATVSNFPFRYEWLNATIGELLVIAAYQYARNKLPYSAGGVSINDKDKDQIYHIMGTNLVNTFKEFAQQRKIAINMSMAYGSIGSDFGYWGSY